MGFEMKLQRRLKDSRRRFRWF